MQTLSVHSSFRAGLVDFLKTVVAFAPVSYVTAKAARPSRELFRIDRAMVDGSHGIGLCDRRVCASKSEESARYRSESARDVCSFLVLRVFACSVYLMPIVVGTATASVDGVHKGYVGWGKNGRWFFGAVLGFLTCVGSIGVFRDVALYKKVLGGRGGQRPRLGTLTAHLQRRHSPHYNGIFVSVGYGEGSHKSRSQLRT